MNKLISSASELNFKPQLAERMPLARRILMVSPAFFHIENPINPHMRQSDGSLHLLDKNLAKLQWEALKNAYKSIGFEPDVLEGVEGLPDMVFCANQAFPIVKRTGEKCVFPSNMANDIRHKEVQHILNFLSSRSVSTFAPSDARTKNTYFEAMGDCLWLPGKRFLLGGYGSRTNKNIYSSISAAAEASVALFELVNPRFYHLDTCLAILNESSAIACKSAFTTEGWHLLNAIFENLIEVDLSEADSPQFACNAHCPDGKHVLIQQGSKKVNAKLRQGNFEVIELNTSEFIKSGGSVFCMKLMYF